MCLYCTYKKIVSDVQRELDLSGCIALEHLNLAGLDDFKLLMTLPETSCLKTCQLTVRVQSKLLIHSSWQPPPSLDGKIAGLRGLQRFFMNFLFVGREEARKAVGMMFPICAKLRPGIMVVVNDPSEPLMW